MACIDRDSAKELVSKHKDLFQNIASKGNFEASLKEIVNKAYLVMLFIKSVFIGLCWWGISLIDPFYGTFFLLFISLVHIKLLLDKDFENVEDNIISAAIESGVVNSNSEEKQDIYPGDAESDDEKNNTAKEDIKENPDTAKT